MVRRDLQLATYLKSIENLCPTPCIKNLSTFFEGLKRDAARQPGSKSRKDSGKRPMEFAVYKFLSVHLMRCTNADALFVRAYLLISWNLMCRSGNTCSVALSHMRWEDDSLAIEFAHMKNDQDGSRSRVFYIGACACMN